MGVHVPLNLLGERPMQIKFYRWLLVIGFLFGAASGSQAIEYTFITIEVDFPSLHDDLFGCAATGINDFGLTVGECNDLTRNSELRGFLYDGLRFSEIDFQNAKTAITEDNQNESIHPLTAKSVYQAAYFQGVDRQGIFSSMRPIVSGVNPQDINSQGEITGWYSDGFRLQGFLKRNGKVLTITVPESLLTEAVGINDIDQIVGDYRDENGFFHGFLYQDGIYRTIDVPFISGPDTGASGINNSGEIVGCYSLCSHGFLYNVETSSFVAIDVPGAVVTQARNINDLGEIVGVYSPDGLTLHGFLYDENDFALIRAPGAIATSLFGINNGGQIVGFYVVENSSGGFDDHAFIAIPVRQ